MWHGYKWLVDILVFFKLFKYSEKDHQDKTFYKFNHVCPSSIKYVHDKLDMSILT